MPDVVIELRSVGRVLGTRQLGVAIRQRVEQVRLKNPTSDIIVDCAGVEIMTVSFADEAFAKLLVGAQPPTGAKLRFRNCSETAKAVLSYVLARRRRP